jgi:hypothetical protein
MRRSILAFAMMAIVVAASAPASARQNEFQGRYRLHARLVQTVENIGCPVENYSRSVYVHYVSEKVRQFGDPVSDAARRFRYRPGERGSWHHTRGVNYRLDYDPATDSAVGTRHTPECIWGVRLVARG